MGDCGSGVGATDGWPAKVGWGNRTATVWLASRGRRSTVARGAGDVASAVVGVASGCAGGPTNRRGGDSPMGTGTRSAGSSKKSNATRVGELLCSVKGKTDSSKVT